MEDTVGTGGEVAAAYQSSSLARLIVDVFVQNTGAVMGLGIVVFMFAFSFAGPLLYHTSQNGVSITATFLPPSLRHPLGTDEVGYDELGRMMLGGQTSLEVGIAAALLATTFGALYGAIAGFVGGWLDAVMMRLVDTLLAIPALFILLFLATVIVPTVPILILVIAFVAWLVPSRLIRGQTLSLRTRDYVSAVRVMGGGPWRIIFRHMLPNAIGTIIVNGTFQVADAILLVAALSFLGLGIPPPAANWGQMLALGIDYVYGGYWWLVWPVGCCIILTVVAFNFIGDALRDAFEVRLQQR